MRVTVSRAHEEAHEGVSELLWKCNRRHQNMTDEATYLMSVQDIRRTIQEACCVVRGNVSLDHFIAFVTRAILEHVCNLCRHPICIL